MAKNLTIVDHPLVQHKLTLMRRKETSTALFRQLLKEVALLLGYEVTRALPLEDIDIETPLMPMRAKVLAGKKVCLVSILRAGNGLLDGMLDQFRRRASGISGFTATRRRWCRSSTTTRFPKTCPNAMPSCSIPCSRPGIRRSRP